MSESVKDVLYVVMPAYNEEDNIEQVVVDWIRVLRYGSKESRLVVADSGSTDDTHNILLRLKKKYSQLEILGDTNKYHGPKVIALYRYAIEKGADFVFQTDSDGQTDSREFDGFWEKRNEYDGILGKRTVRGDGRGRAFVERIVCLLLKIFFGIKVEDANAPFRLMRSDLLKKYLGKIPNEYGLPNVILTAFFVRFKEKILFKEIKFAPRKAGKNSINFKKIFNIGLRSLVDFWNFRKDMVKNEEVGGKPGVKSVAIVGIFAVIAGLLVIASPAFPWNGGVEMTDSSVFLTVGRQMEEGLMPYTDTFDHKGPLLYIVNFFGVIINETKGIFLFEFLAIFFTLWFMLKIFKLKGSNINSWFSVMMTLLLFTPFVNLYLKDAGNLTEQYAMPFIAYSLYVFLKYFLEGGVSLAKVFWSGVGFACVLMMRINMVGVWAIFCVAIIGECLYQKKYKELRNNILMFVLGSLSVIMPVIIWLGVNGALGSFVDAYITFNFSYSGESTDGIVQTILYFMSDIIIVLSLCLTIGLVMSGGVKERLLKILYLVAYVGCIVGACMSGRIYSHYGMVLVPFAVFPFSFFCYDLSLNKGIKNSVVYSALALFLVSLTFNSWIEVARRGDDAFNRRSNNDEIVQAIDEVCGYVEANSDISERITVYGNMNIIYLKCNRLPASRYSYQFPISEVRPSILDDYYKEIENNRPKVFVLQKQYNNDRGEQY